MEIKIIYTKLYVPFVTLLAQDMINLLKQLDSDFKRTINQNKYQSKKKNKSSAKQKVRSFNYPSLPGVNTRFVLSYKDKNGRESYKQHYLPTVEIKDYDVTNNGRNHFDQSIKNHLKTYDKIRNISTDQDGGNTTGYVLYYPCFKKTL